MEGVELELVRWVDREMGIWAWEESGEPVWLAPLNSMAVELLVRLMLMASDEEKSNLSAINFNQFFYCHLINRY